MKFLEYLHENQVKKMHEATLRLLEELGIDAPDSQFRSVLLENGCKLKNGRVAFPPDIVEKYLKLVPSKFSLFSRDKETVLEIGSKSAYSQTCSGTPYILDVHTSNIRNYLMQDLADMSRLADSLPNINIVCCGLPKDIDPDIYMLSEIVNMLRNTKKPLRLPIESAEDLDAIVRVLEVVFGDREEIKQNPTLYLEISPISPLEFPKEQGEGIIKLAEMGIPIGIIPCNMMGATGPMTLVGSVVQQNAEVVAGMVAGQMANPGIPMIMSPRVTFMDMKTGVGLWSAPELGIAGACSASLANYYNVPVSVTGFSSAAKVTDYQSGYERCYNGLLGALMGADVLAAAGSLDNAMISSYVQLVMDDELTSMLQRTIKGTEVNDDTLAVEIVREIVEKDICFLEHEHTIKYLRKGELWEPTISNRASYEIWQKNKDTAETKAKEKVISILQSEKEPILDKHMNEEIERIMSSAKKAALAKKKVV
ncbi:trimethylamine methyltransferase family protein [Desulfitibacter alkalitolerans]|uniref:trimethylamine methyltransferase family protein n=1 Tax=Desulfitibacter alkalitolerans TaxID=264641 RepID=UPI00048447AC|nr:trimethylamine methyltransferase family protein [Desulfitibacter alkalitolerans]